MDQKEKSSIQQISNPDSLLDVLIRYEPPHCSLPDHTDKELNLVCTDKRCQTYFNLMCIKCSIDNIHNQPNHQSCKLKDVLISFCKETQKKQDLESDSLAKSQHKEINQKQLQNINKVLQELQIIKNQIEEAISHIENLKQTCLQSSPLSQKQRAEQILQDLIHSKEKDKNILESELKQVFQIAEFSNGSLNFRDSKSIKNVQEELDWKTENLNIKIDRFLNDLNFFGYLNKDEKQNEKQIQIQIAKKLGFVEKSEIELLQNQNESLIKQNKLNQQSANNFSEDDQNNSSLKNEHNVQMKENWIRKNYRNGIYYGEVRTDQIGNNKHITRHGVGIFVYKDGDKYDGHYENGERTGQGIYLYANGNQYEGYFLNGKFHGKGVYLNFANGNIYEGEFLNGKFHGQGKYIYQNGECFQGDFFEGKSLKLRQIKTSRSKSTNNAQQNSNIIQQE